MYIVVMYHHKFIMRYERLCNDLLTAYKDGIIEGEKREVVQEQEPDKFICR